MLQPIESNSNWAKFVLENHMNWMNVGKVLTSELRWNEMFRGVQHWMLDKTKPAYKK